MPLKDALTIMNRTTELLMEMPMYKHISNENSKLKEEMRHLKYQNMYLEMKNRMTTKKLKNMKKMYDNLFKKYENNDKDEVIFVEVKKEKVDVISIEEEPIKYEVVETLKPDDICIKKEEEVVYYEYEFRGEQLGRLRAYNKKNDKETEDEYTKRIWDMVTKEDDEEKKKKHVYTTHNGKYVEEVVVEKEEEEEEVVEVEGEEEEEVVEVEGEEEEEVVEVEGEEEEDEVEVEEVEEEVVEVEEEEEEEEEEVEEEDEEVIVDVEEEEDGVYETVIKGKTYYISNEIDSFIYKEDENGEISMEVGKYVDGKPTFYKK